MKNTLIILSVLFLFLGCKKDKKKTTGADNNTTPIENVDENSGEEEEVDDTLVVPNKIADFLKNKMPGYEIVPREKWLSEEYINGLSKSMRPLYKNDILIEGDFNGDGEEDFATFLMDKKGEVSLYAFHKTGDTYKKYLLQREGKSSFLGAGLEVEEPGFIYGGNKEAGLGYNGINYNIYEKTGTTFYYDAGRYRKILTSD